MTDSVTERVESGRGVVLGWLSGLGVFAVPWLVSGVVSTFLPDPETSFPWLFLAALVAMVGWIAYGIARIPRFARGALIGSAIVIGVVAALLLLLHLF
jgi:hypothetical protein